MGVWVYDRGGGLVFAESQPTKHPPTPSHQNAKIPYKNLGFSLLKNRLKKYIIENSL